MIPHILWDCNDCDAKYIHSIDMKESRARKVDERILKDAPFKDPTDARILCIRDAYELSEIRIS